MAEAQARNHETEPRSKKALSSLAAGSPRVYWTSRGQWCKLLRVVPPAHGICDPHAFFSSPIATEPLVWTFETFVEESQRQTTVDDLRAVFARAMADDGFENYVVGTIIDGAVTSIGWASLPDGHLETYLAERWDKVDPVLAVAIRATRPFCWDAIAPNLQFTVPQTAFLDECKRIGVHSIIVSPFQNPNGCCDVVGLSRRHPDPPDPARVPVLLAACAQAWWRYSDLTGNSLRNDPEIDCLTSRELEILKWVKHGKNNTEISELISVSTKTIEYHIGNILKKLDASNRTAAVVIALRNKLLTL